MASPLDIELPPGFEDMSREEQVRYAQKLWNHVAPKPEELSVPAWQIELAKQRLEEHLAHPDDVVAHDEVVARVRERARLRQTRDPKQGGDGA